MRFRRKKTKNQHNRLDKQLVRKYIWKNPSIIEDIFSDQEWTSHKEDPSQNVPSTKMAQYIQDQISKESKQPEDKTSKNLYIRRFTYYAAASVLLLFALGTWIWLKPVPPTQSPEIVVHQEKTTPNSDTTWLSITNKGNTVQAHILPDHSTVKLFANSSLRFSKHFTAHSREIYLDGKAYFSVKKDPSRPFSVYASGTKTTALGTSFTIDTRSTSTYTSVQLHSGKVVVSSLAALPTFENTYLKNAGESLSFDANMHIVAHHVGTIKEQARMISLPKKNKSDLSLLQLNNIALSEVFESLNNTYDTTIKIGEQDISKIQYTGSIDPQRESLQDVLAVICLINNLRYVQEPDGSYTIYRQTETVNDQLKNQ